MNPNTLFSASTDNTIKIWNTDTFELIETCQDSDIISYVVVINQTSIAFASNDFSVKIWNKIRLNWYFRECQVNFHFLKIKGQCIFRSRKVIG